MWRRAVSRCSISPIQSLSKWAFGVNANLSGPVPFGAIASRARLCSTSASAAPLTVAKEGMRVKVDMKMALPDGTVLDETPDVAFVCGVGQMLPGVDAVVQGMSVGETREVTLEAADAFGEKEDENIVEVPVAQLPPDSKAGNVLSTPDGGRAVILSVKGETATVDHNHILAGRSVVFTAKLVECSDLPELAHEVQAPGDGVSFPKEGDTLTMHYTGTLAANGIVFDSSRGEGKQPITFTIGVGQVIKGWDTAVMQMSLGERSILRIPHELGYGETGSGDAIPPNSDLVFDVELLKIN